MRLIYFAHSLSNGYAHFFCQELEPTNVVSAPPGEKRPWMDATANEGAAEGANTRFATVAAKLARYACLISLLTKTDSFSFTSYSSIAPLSADETNFAYLAR